MWCVGAFQSMRLTAAARTKGAVTADRRTSRTKNTKPPTKDSRNRAITSYMKYSRTFPNARFLQLGNVFRQFAPRNTELVEVTAISLR